MLILLIKSLNKVNDIRIVNKGIVPIKVEATLLSTYISLKLIKLKGITLPKIAIGAAQSS